MSVKYEKGLTLVYVTEYLGINTKDFFVYNINTGELELGFFQGIIIPLDLFWKSPFILINIFKKWGFIFLFDGKTH